MSDINWKSKYEALKAKYLTDLDMAFRLGHEQGQQEASMDAMAQQQQQQADQMATQTGMQGDGQNGEGQSGEQVDQDQPQDNVSAHPGGSELDQHISELESMLGKGEVSSTDLMKSVKQLREFQKQAKLQNDLKKSSEAISGIAKALHKPAFKISQQAKHNLSSAAEKAVNMQQQIVEDVMKSWKQEEEKASKDILSQLKVEGVLKG